MKTIHLKRKRCSAEKTKKLSSVFFFGLTLMEYQLDSKPDNAATEGRSIPGKPCSILPLCTQGVGIVRRVQCYFSGGVFDFHPLSRNNSPTPDDDNSR